MRALRIVTVVFVVLGAGCGGCSDHPASGQDACVGSACACSADMLDCGAGCIDVTDDPANCGACGHDCGGGACSAGVCMPESLALVPNAPSELRVSGDDLVFVTRGEVTSSGTVYRLAKTGGVPAVIYRGLADYPALAIADDGTVLVADTGQAEGCSTQSSAGSLLSFTSGTPTLVATGRRCVDSLTPTSTGLAWVEEVPRNFFGGGDPDPWVGALLAGAPPDQVPTFLRPPTTNRRPQHTTRSGEAVMWSEDNSILQSEGGVQSIVLTAPVSGFATIDAFSVDTDNIAYTLRPESGSSAQLVLHARATDEETTLAEGLGVVDQLAFDTDFVYLLSGGVMSAIDVHTHELHELPGGAVQAFAQDDRFLYVLVEKLRGVWPRTEVVRLRKPAVGAAVMTTLACDAPFAQCDEFDAACTDLSSNDDHCGSCDLACAPTERCVASSCVCAASSLVCGGTCVDPATDAANCGACGRSCGGGTCAGGDCTPVKVADFANAAVHDTSAVYYAASSQIRRFDKSSATDSLVSQLVAPFVYARYVAQDATRIFIAADEGTIGLSNPGGIYATAKTGTGSVPATLYANRPNPRYVAISNTTLVWTEDASDSVETPIQLIYAAANGSAILGSVSTMGLYAGSDTADVRGVAVAGSIVYWLLGNSTTDGGAIVRVDLTTSPATPTVVTELDAYPYSIAVVGTELYVTAGWPDGKVLSLPLAGGPITVHDSGLLYPSGLASAPDGSILWLDGDTTQLVLHQRAPTAANPRVIQSGNQLDYNTVLLVDDDRLFSASSNGVFVMQR
jgi:hypothetical protein